MKKFRILVSVAVVACVVGGALPSFAADDATLKLGKEVFKRKDDKKSSCNTCHPKGETNDAIVEGKKVPNLKKTVAKMSSEKVAEHVKDQVKKRMVYKLTDDEMAALSKFVEALGK